MIGWPGRIRTSTVCINSAASCQLDHGPAVALEILQYRGLQEVGRLDILRPEDSVPSAPAGLSDASPLAGCCMGTASSHVRTH